MYIVPLIVRVFVVAFQPITPLVAVFHTSVWPLKCEAATLPLAPRVTVHVVVPKPPVTSIDSSSTLIVNCELGKPVAEATVSVVWEDVIAPASVVFAPGPTRQKYELEGVRSTGVETLL